MTSNPFRKGAVLFVISAIFIVVVMWVTRGETIRHRRGGRSGHADGAASQGTGRIKVKSTASFQGEESVARDRLLRRPRSHNENNDDALLQDIAHGRVHLMDVKITNRRLLGKGGGMTGIFCRLDFALQKQDPSATPMFHNLVSNSPDCTTPRSMEFGKAVQAARNFDEQAAGKEDTAQGSDGDGVRVLNLTAVVFHMSRCGSTLVSNLLVAANPEEHRVYSESNPPAVALLDVCGDGGERVRHCNLRTASRILSDVVYMMSRSNDPKERRVFFKFQSITTTAVQIFQMAFPTTPWMFVYRDPVHVMQSQLRNGEAMANCVRSKVRPPARALEILDKHEATVQSVSSEAYCAVHLASITESAVDAWNDKAIPINYGELPGALYDVVQHDLDLGFKTRSSSQSWSDALARMEATSKLYSKGKNKVPQVFEGDSQQKEEQASDEVKSASAEYLSESYRALEAASAQRVAQHRAHESS